MNLSSLWVTLHLGLQDLLGHRRLVLIMALSLAAGYVRFDPKFPAETWLWLGVNLGFTCMA